MLAKPVFLMCSERSGSNLISRIFDAHSEVCAPGIAHLIRCVSEESWHLGEDANSLVLSLFRKKVSSWRVDEVIESLHDKLLEQDNPYQMVSVLYNEELKLNKKKRIFLKENAIHSFLPALSHFSKQPQFLHQVRDPRDMALSWGRAKALRGGTIRATQRWINDQMGFLRAKAWLGNDPKRFIRYEDLISDPEAQLLRACAWLDLNFEENMVQFHLNSESATVDAKRSEAWKNISRPIIQNNSEKYHEELPKNHQLYIEAKCIELMNFYNYEPVFSVGEIVQAQENIAVLEQEIAIDEKIDKPEYFSLSKVERGRLEDWSRCREKLRWSA